MTNEIEDRLESFLSLTKSLDEAKTLNYELNNLLHQKIEALGKNQIYLERLQTHTEQLQSANRQLSRKIQEAEWATRQAESSLNNLLNSKAWRLTAPLRWIFNITAQIVNKILSLPSKLKAYTKVFLVHAALFIRRRPRLKRVLLRIINRIPKLRTKINSLISRIQTHQQPSTENVTSQTITVDVLGHRAKKIYHQFIAENNNNSSQKGF